MSIVATRLSVIGNRTSFSITIKNSGNVSVALEAVSLHGVSMKAQLLPHAISRSTSTKSSEDSANDSNTCTSSEVEYPNELVFLPNASSSNLVPVSSSDSTQNSSAIILQQGQSATMGFNGTNVAEGNEILKWVKKLPGVKTVRMNIVEYVVHVYDWLSKEADKRAKDEEKIVKQYFGRDRKQRRLDGRAKSDV